MNWKLAIATLTVFPGMAIGTAIFRYYSSRAYRRRARRLAEVTGQLQEDISGVRVVQAFRREGTNYERFVEINGHYRAANDPTVIASADLLPLRRPALGARDGRGARLRRHARVPRAT